METYAAALPSNAAAVSYLTKRGLSEGSAQSFKLGVVESPFPGHEQYLGRLVVPYLTLGGVCGASFRCIAHEDCKGIHNDKYLWPAGFSRRMFNTPALDIDSPFIAICEGEMDTITTQQAGIPAVGIPGAKAWQSFWGRCFKGYETVYILADHDDDGSSQEMAEKISRSVPTARTILMPEGHDVNSFVLENGPEALRLKMGVSTP
ncbi:toprim domain-containing protein [Kitasatospora mediocidica]|uniref:toprim domain-containing protein n=1 Tax=Kitasatospora mediocidica TaxID=58352 RepID=UPI00068A5B50|nr:toprim domain-containing protein [Kitasatospora mediocidica]